MTPTPTLRSWSRRFAAGFTWFGLAAFVVAGDGWRDLFPAGDTAAWRSVHGTEFPPNWRIDEEGNLAWVARGHSLITREVFGDFELEFEWRVSPGGNSGVFYRVVEGLGAIHTTGPEYQILDNQRHGDGRHPRRTAASCYDLYAPAADVTRPVGEWNHGRIVARGPHIEHWLNGERVVAFEIGSDDWRERVAASKFRADPHFAAAARGAIVLQDHNDPVWYRHVRIRLLDTESAAPEPPAAPAPASAP
jgi:hypothetical protein